MLLNLFIAKGRVAGRAKRASRESTPKLSFYKVQCEPEGGELNLFACVEKTVCLFIAKGRVAGRAKRASRESTPLELSASLPIRIKSKRFLLSFFYFIHYFLGKSNIYCCDANI
jgi:hypothetical protein